MASISSSSSLKSSPCALAISSSGICLSISRMMYIFFADFYATVRTRKSSGRSISFSWQ